jgi:hypothetical protein
MFLGFFPKKKNDGKINPITKGMINQKFCVFTISMTIPRKVKGKTTLRIAQISNLVV